MRLSLQGHDKKPTQGANAGPGPSRKTFIMSESDTKPTAPAKAADTSRSQPSDKKIQVAAASSAPAQKPVVDAKEVTDAVDDDDLLMYDEGGDNDDDYDDDDEYWSHFFDVTLAALLFSESEIHNNQLFSWKPQLL